MGIKSMAPLLILVISVDVTKEFQNLQRELDDFKKFLQGLEIASREEEIKKAYLGKLASFRWLPNVVIETKAVRRQGVPKEALLEVLQQIKVNPTQAKKLLLQILQKFPMQPRDQEILAETFASLSYAEMEKAILDLKKNFS